MLRTPYLQLDESLVPFLESGCALIVGSAAPDGTPYAARGWGLDVLDAAAGRIRVLVVADELPFLGPRLAVTSTSVRTLHSVQMKGTVEAVEPTVGEADVERSQRYRDHFFGEIVDTDGSPLELLERMQPPGPMAAMRVVVEELYDQTPGPTAGTPLGR